MTSRKRPLQQMIATASLAVALVGSCRADEGSDTNEVFMACDQPEVKACNEATGKNEGFKGECSGDLYASCPTEDRVGSCLISGGTEQEATRHYYEGSMDNGKTDCEVQQSVLNGVYTSAE